MRLITPELNNHIESMIQDCVPQLSVNCVIFRYQGRKLQIAVAQYVFNDLTLLPGGFVKQNEDIDEAAHSVIKEQIGVTNCLISKVGVFGEINRDFIELYDGFRKAGMGQRAYDWLAKRFISVVYYSVIEDQPTKTLPNPLFSEVSWLDIGESGMLGMDHKDIVEAAHKNLKNDVLRLPVLPQFMPSTFTIPQLQGLYEAIYQRSIDRGNFRQRMLKLGILKRTGARERQISGRPAELYSFDLDVYHNSLSTTVKLGF